MSWRADAEVFSGRRFSASRAIFRVLTHVRQRVAVRVNGQCLGETEKTAIAEGMKRFLIDLLVFREASVRAATDLAAVELILKVTCRANESDAQKVINPSTRVDRKLTPLFLLDKGLAPLPNIPDRRLKSIMVNGLGESISKCKRFQGIYDALLITFCGFEEAAPAICFAGQLRA